MKPWRRCRFGLLPMKSKWIIGPVAVLAVVNVLVGILWMYAHFVRVSSQDEMSLRCALGLRVIFQAKNKYLVDHPDDVGRAVPVSDLQGYVAIPDLAVYTHCPAGGVVRVNALGVCPTCSIADHQALFRKCALTTR